MTFRTSDGAFAGYNRVPADSIGTTPPVGAGTVGSPVLNQAQALKLFNYVPPAPPVPPPSGFKFYRIYLSPLAPRAYLSEVQFCLSETFDAGQLVVPTSHAVPTEGGNMANGNVLYDGAWPSPYWSGPTNGEWGAYTFVCFGLAQAYPVRTIRIRLGGGGPSFDTVRVDRSNDETPFGSNPFNGKNWNTENGIVSPTWNSMPNGYADLSVAPT